MADLSPASLMTPEQQLRAVQTKAQHAAQLALMWAVVPRWHGCHAHSRTRPP